MTRWLITLCLLLLPSTGWAAIAYVSTTDSAANTVGVSTLTTSVIVPSGTDRLMAVCVQTRSQTADTTVTGVTYNGTALTLAKTNANGMIHTDLWYLVAPTVTTANVVVSWSSANNTSAAAYSVALLTGVSQSSPVDASAGGSGTGTTLSSIITTVADVAWVVDCAYNTNNGGLTVGSGQTGRTVRNVNTASADDGVGMSTVNGKTPAGAETMDWTSASGSWVMSAVSFAPSGGAAAPTSSPSQATLSWTNGTDAVGVTGTTIRRCVGTSCTPTTTLTTVPSTQTTYPDTSLGSNTTYGYSVANFDAAGNASTFTAAVYITTGTTFRTTLGTDSFDRADNADLNGTWDAGYTARFAGRILSNQVAASTTTSMETYNAVSTPNDQWAQFTASAWTIANGNVFIRLRNADSPTDTGYECGVITSGTTAVLREINAGVTTTTIASTALTNTGAAGDKFRCEVQGTALKLYQIRGTAETLIASGSNAVHTIGKTGFRIGDTAIPSVLLNDFAMGGFSSVAPVAPTIATLALDATGASLTYGATTPTSIRVTTFTGLSTVSSVVYPISSFPGGRFTQSWVAGLNGACFVAIDSLGVENTISSAYQCRPLTGIVAAADTTPAVLTNPVPTTSLPFNTTSTTISVTLDKPASCIANTTDVAYASMDNTLTMSLNGLVASIALTGLTNGSSTTRYIRCNFTNTVDAQYPNLTSTTITATVLAGAGADTTAPSTVAGLLGVAQGPVVTLTWTLATDNVLVSGYQVYQSTDACVTPMLAGNPVTTTSTQLNLIQNTAYCFTVKAIDSSNNLSAAHSNQALVTTGTIPDLNPPSDMVGLAILGRFKQSILLGWTTGTDTEGAVTTSIEQCTVVSGSDCSNFVQLYSGIALSRLQATLTAGTAYCFRGRHSDAGGNTGAYSAVVCGMTLTSGLPQPRTQIPFGVQRLPRN